jgi:hypothetical protein
MSRSSYQSKHDSASSGFKTEISIKPGREDGTPDVIEVKSALVDDIAIEKDLQVKKEYSQKGIDLNDLLK